MKIIFIILIICFEWNTIFGQLRDFTPVTTDSIFYSDGHQFKYQGLDYESARALKKVLNIDVNSELYGSIRQYTRTKRWMTVLEIIGVGSIGATVDGFWVPESEVRPEFLLVGLASVGSSFLLWKKSRRQLRNFVDDYNHAVYDKYIKQRFMSSNVIPSTQISVGFSLKF